MAENLTYPSNLNDLVENGAGLVHFKFFERPNASSSIHLNDIFLYMPKNINNNTQVSYEQLKYGGLADKASQRMADTGVDNIASDLSNVISSMTMQDARSVSQGVLQSAINSTKLGSSGKSLYNQATGRILNPYMSMTFKGLEFKKYELEFEFTPHNENESITIKDIVKTFKKASLPSKIGNQLSFPMEMEIDYINSKQSEWLPKYKRSVITGVNVNYSGSGQFTSMIDGSPSRTILTISFTENQKVFRSDIDNGY